MILLGRINEPCDSCNRKKDVYQITASNERKKEAYHLHLCDLCIETLTDMVDDNKQSYRMDENGNLTPVDKN